MAIEAGPSPQARGGLPIKSQILIILILLEDNRGGVQLLRETPSFPVLSSPARTGRRSAMEAVMFRLRSDAKRIHNTAESRSEGSGELTESRAKKAQDRAREATQYLPIEDNEMPA